MLSSLHALAVSVWLLSFAAATVVRPRGSLNETAPYRNVSAISTTPVTPSTIVSSPLSSAWVQSLSRYSFGTAVSYDFHSQPQPTSVSSNSTNTNTTHSATVTTTTPSCTINIPNANINWWFQATYAFPMGTLTPSAPGFSNTGNSYVTLLTATTTFDVTSALATDVVYIETTSYDPDFEYTFTFQTEFTLRPSAALTSVVTRTAFAPLPTGNVIPASEVTQYDLYDVFNLPVATTTLSVAPNSTFVATSALPFLYFTAYEIVFSGGTTAVNGRVSNGTSTETVTLPYAHVYPYNVKGIESLATVTGSVPDEFLRQISPSACSAGDVQATVTVMVVVDIIYVDNRNQAPFIIHFESTALGFEEEPTRVQVNSKETSKPVPFTMPDLNEPNGPAGEIVTDVNPLVQGPAQPTDTTLHNANNSPPSNAPSDHTIGTIGTNPVVVGPSSVVIIGTQTLQPGGTAITVGSTPVSLAPSGTALVVGSTTLQLPSDIFDPLVPTQPAPPLLTIGSSTLTPNAATQFFLGPEQTLTPGGIATIKGTTISLDSAASFFVVDGTTQLPVAPTRPAALQQADSGPLVLTVGSETFSIAPSVGQFVVGDQTLTPGGTITVDGTTIALAPEATALIVNGQTTLINSPAAPIVTKPPILTIGQETFNAVPGYGTTFIISGQTLTPGGTITLRDLTVILEPGATQLIYGSAGSSITKTLFPATRTESILVTTAEPSAGATSNIGEATQTTRAQGAASIPVRYSVATSVLSLVTWLIVLH